MSAIDVAIRRVFRAVRAIRRAQLSVTINVPFMTAAWKEQ